MMAGLAFWPVQVCAYAVFCLLVLHPAAAVYAAPLHAELPYMGYALELVQILWAFGVLQLG